MKKTLIAMLLVAVMTFAFVVPAIAENGITPEEQALLDKIQNGYICQATGEQVTPFPKYITLATQELIRRDLTAEQIQLVSDCIDRCYAIMIAEDAPSYASMKHSPNLQTIVDDVTHVANILGYTLTFNYDNGDVAVKQTGSDMTATFVVMAVLAAAMIVGVVLTKKKDSVRA